MSPDVCITTSETDNFVKVNVSMIEILDWIGRISAGILVIALLVGIYGWSRGIIPAMVRLGNGFAKRKIAIFARSNQFGTAPLTGERAQRDFPRPSSWTLGHVGIRQRPGTGTPSWTFGQGGFCHKLPRRTPSSLRLDPRRGSDLVPEQFGETPEMVGQTTGHSWRLSQGPLGFSHCSLAEGLMETAKVVGTPNQVHACLKGLEPMSGMATLAR